MSFSLGLPGCGNKRWQFDSASYPASTGQCVIASPVIGNGQLIQHIVPSNQLTGYWYQNSSGQISQQPLPGASSGQFLDYAEVAIPPGPIVASDLLGGGINVQGGQAYTLPAASDLWSAKLASGSSALTASKFRVVLSIQDNANGTVQLSSGLGGTLINADGNTSQVAPGELVLLIDSNLSYRWFIVTSNQP